LNEQIKQAEENVKKRGLAKIVRLNERLEKESNNSFYICKSACTRMTFEKSMEFNFKCPECGEVMQEQDNARTKEFLTQQIKELETKKLC
jgi:transcription initiation factor TFIIE subunit alpha